ncbi:hypothetical protein [Anaerolinea thermophila]|uniref:hypothetical protein n=2 Tax=Anaerolinea TaxID=233189 RepID=UPI0026ECDC04|nr:hypothetical protein [Anaerolinea thermophila]
MNLFLRRGHWTHTVAILLAGAGVFLYLWMSHQTYRIGFPLDDAWIHQTYARNLAKGGEWAFIPGQPSAGSTAPLWSFLLAVGYWTSPSIPYGWTFFLGGMSLLGLMIVAQNWFQRETGIDLALGALLIGMEWHLLWAALSGMETALMAVLVLTVLWLMGAFQPWWGVMGILIGVGIWIRPDAITLTAPVLLMWLWKFSRREVQWIQAGKFLAGFLILFVPYIAFNWLISGSVFPNTFYAKQAEYALLYEISVWVRFLRSFGVMLVGAGGLLLPGFVWGIFLAFREKRIAYLLTSAWVIGYVALYALRLPVTYQHGRYLMPAMPVYFVLALMGTVQLVRGLSLRRWGWIISRVWIGSIAGVTLGFVFLGAQAYATDVAIIETEMVETAQWVQQNTPSDALIAVHDIGAIGYFSQRKLVDLAGLVSPEVIPFIRDETRLREFLDGQQVDYLVTFPGWYEHLTDGKPVVYQSRGKFAPQAGGENMTVYRWR